MQFAHMLRGGARARGGLISAGKRAVEDAGPYYAVTTKKLQTVKLGLLPLLASGHPPPLGEGTVSFP